MPTTVIIALAVSLAIAPVVIWYFVLLRQEHFQKRILFWIFIGGSLSVIPIFLLQYFWKLYPAFDVLKLIESQVANAAEAAILTFVVVGIIEEVMKHSAVRLAEDRHPEYVQTLKHALVFSLVSGLGFAFAENIFYFYNIYIVYGVGDLISSFVFRSIFTAMGHMVFSAIFGYYFGIAKFAHAITSYEKLIGKKFYVTKLFGRLFGWKTYEVYRQKKILQGLLIAMGLHAVFNFLLEMQKVVPVMILIMVSALYVYYLMKRTTGNLLFSFSERRHSTMAPGDESVVIELLGMWSNEGRYQEVMEICDRLLAKDPDNNVVKLFKAKAKENLKLKTVYEKLKQTMQKTKPAEISATVATVITPDTAMKAEDEQIIAEVMDMWFKEEKYSQVVEVAQRLLARNPQSKGARVILEKAFNKQKIEELFGALGKLFND